MIHAASSGKNLPRNFLVFSACMLLSLTLVSFALGRPFRLGRLPDKGENSGCATCHVFPGGPRDPFGQDYEKIAIEAGDRYTEELGKMDSDGDGFINHVEFVASAYPGEPESKPAEKAETQQEQDKAVNKTILYEVGQYLGLVGFVLILIQYVLSSRIRLIEKRAGLDKLFIIHRKVGMLGLMLIFFHPISLFAYNGLKGYNLFWKSVGIIGLVILLVAAGTAILYAKLRLKYETWKNIHRANYAIFPLAFAHSISLGGDLYGRSPMKIIWLAFACIYVIISEFSVMRYSNLELV